MSSFNTVAASADIDDLPSPLTTSGQDRSAPVLRRPLPLPDVADSGRITFGAGFRLPTKN